MAGLMTLAILALMVFGLWAARRMVRAGIAQMDGAAKSYSEHTKAVAESNLRGRPMPVAAWQPPERGVVISRYSHQHRGLMRGAGVPSMPKPGKC